MRRTPLFFLSVTTILLVLLLTGFLHVQTSKAARPTYLTIGSSGTPHDAPIHHALTSLSATTTGSNPLSYYGGPVMQSSITYAIFWEPPTLQDGTTTYVSSTYNSLIEQYFNDVGGSGLYNNNIQYYDTTGHMLNSSTLGGVWFDSSPYPPSTCTDSYTPHGCISDNQIKAEVLNAMNVNSWSGGVNHAFFVFTAWGEGSCHGDCAFSNFCAFHNYFTSNSQSIVYANMPYMGTDLPNCGTNTSPNSDPDADATINYLSHEHMEMVTDPLLNAWHDANNGEIGDKCGAKYGTLSYDNGTANEAWNGHYYIVQEEFSDALNGCVQTRAMSGTLYVGSDDNNLYALNAPDGSSLWNQPTGSKVVSSPTVVNGVVYVGSLDHSIYAFKTSDHSLLWQYPTNGPLYSSPTVVKGILYIGSSDDNLYAINATTGKLLWHFATGGAITSSPTVASGIVYVGSSDHNLYALNATKGSRKWLFPTGGPITSSPAVLKGAVYVGSQDDNLYSINASTGLLNWKATTNGPITQSSPDATGTTIYIGSSDGSVYAFSTTNGSQLWSYPTGAAVSSSPKVFSGVVYIGSTNNNLYALKATNGSLIWNYVTGGQIVSSPTVIDGIVYFGSNDGNIYALWFNDATLLWIYSTSSAVESSPAVVLGSY